MYCIPGSPTCARFELVKSPEVTLCGWCGYNYKPWINNINDNQALYASACKYRHDPEDADVSS